MSRVQDERAPKDPMYVKLNSALRFAKRTCSIGSSNKISDIRRTLGWSYAAHRIRHYGQWHPSSSASKELANKPLAYNAKTDKLEARTLGWYFEASISKTLMRPRFPSCNPLQDEIFNLQKEHKRLLTRALLTQYSRQGNCGDMSRLICKYLWERAEGIKNIQFVKCRDFDHAFVIVNAKGKLHDPSSWGNAWVIDPWAFESGIVYHAKDFKKNFDEIKAFAEQQLKSLDEINYQPPQGRMDAKYATSTLDLVVKIKPHKHKYPSYSKALEKPIEYYYELCHAFGKESKWEVHYRQEHKVAFTSSLREIEKGVELRPSRPKQC